MCGKCNERTIKENNTQNDKAHAQTQSRNEKFARTIRKETMRNKSLKIAL